MGVFYCPLHSAVSGIWSGTHMSACCVAQCAAARIRACLACLTQSSTVVHTALLRFSWQALIGQLRTSSTFEGTQEPDSSWQHAASTV
jgi:hypothetical protein